MSRLIGTMEISQYAQRYNMPFEEDTPLTMAWCFDMVDAAERKGREETIEELKSKKEEIIRWLIKRDKEGYGTTNGELLDHIFELAEQLKEQRINENNIADNTGSDT